MTNRTTIRAAAEAREILLQFERLESLGAFVDLCVDEQKQTFLTLALVNFARREKLRAVNIIPESRDSPFESTP